MRTGLAVAAAVVCGSILMFAVGQPVHAEPAQMPGIWLGIGPGGPAQTPPAHPPSWWGKRVDGAQMFLEPEAWPVTLAHTTTALTAGHAIATACFEVKSSLASKTCPDLGVGKDHSLEQYFRNIKAHHMTFALEIGLLVDSEAAGDKITRACASEAGGTEADLRQALAKIKQAGGNLDYLRMDEPFYNGVVGCHETPEHVAEHLQRTISRIVRSYFPNAKIGDVEPVTGDRDQPRTIAQWADAYKSALGVPLAFFHADASWTAGRPAINFPVIESAMHERGIPFGVIYDSADDSSTLAWTRDAIQNFTETEAVEGVKVDHAIFQSWTAEPDTQLPETKTGTLTNVVYQYLLPASHLSMRAIGGKALRVHLTGPDDRPVAAARLSGEVIGSSSLRDLQTNTLSGTAPANAAYVVVGIRANTEGAAAATDGEADLGRIQLHYVSSTGARSIWTSSFATPKRIAISVSRSIVANLSGVAAKCGLQIMPIAAKSAYTLSVPIAATISADQAGYVTLIFFDAECHGLSRRFIMFKPPARPLALPPTDANGDVDIPLTEAMTGRGKQLKIFYEGDNRTHRPTEMVIDMQSIAPIH